MKTFLAVIAFAITLSLAANQTQAFKEEYIVTGLYCNDADAAKKIAELLHDKHYLRAAMLVHIQKGRAGSVSYWYFDEIQEQLHWCDVGTFVFNEAPRRGSSSAKFQVLAISITEPIERMFFGFTIRDLRTKVRYIITDTGCWDEDELTVTCKDTADSSSKIN